MEAPDISLISRCMPSQIKSIDEASMRWDWHAAMYKENYFDNEDLKKLLSQYQLECHYDNLLFIGNIVFYKLKIGYQSAVEYIDNQNLIISELLDSLLFFQENKEKAKAKLFYRNEILITHPELLDALESGLKNYVKKNKKAIFHMYPSVKDYNNFDEYLKIRLDQFSKRKNKKGGQPKDVSLKIMVYCLWNYLDIATNFNVKTNNISKRQLGIFIYEFLRVFNYIDKLATPGKTISDYYDYFLKKHINQIA